METIHLVPQEDHRHLYLRTVRGRLHNSQTCLLATSSSLYGCLEIGSCIRKVPGSPGEFLLVVQRHLFATRCASFLALPRCRKLYHQTKSNFLLFLLKRNVLMQRVIKKYILKITTCMSYRIYNLKYVIFRLKNQILFENATCSFLPLLIFRLEFIFL